MHLSSLPIPPGFMGLKAVTPDGKYLLVTMGGSPVKLADCFLFSLESQKLDLISSNADGTEADSESYCVGVSDDGKRVAFTSRSVKEGVQLYVRDRAAKTSTRISGCPDGSVSKMSGITSTGVAFSRDGKHAFYTFTDWCNGNTKSPWKSFLAMATVRPDGSLDRKTLNIPGGGVLHPVFTKSGTKLSVVRYVESGIDSPKDVTIVDVATGAATIGTTDPVGIALNDKMLGGAIGGNGEQIVFSSQSDKIVGSDYNGRSDVFVKQLGTGKFDLVSRTPAGNVADHNSYVSTTQMYSGLGAISDDSGRYVLFYSYASDLTEKEIRGAHCYLYDRVTKKTVLVDKNSGGVPGDAICEPISVTSTPIKVLFRSAAKNLVSQPISQYYQAE
jgi:hypothetical protein